MDLPRLLFVAIGVLGTLGTACVLLGERRWHRRIADLRLLLVLAAFAWVPATIELVVNHEMLRAQEVSGWISDQLIEIFQLPTTTSSSTTTTVP